MILSARPRPFVGGLQALALARAHGAVVKIEVQEADLISVNAGFFVANILPRLTIKLRPAGKRRFGDARQLVGERLRRRQLERDARTGTLGVADPHGAVDSRTEQRCFAPGDHFAGLAATQLVFGPGIEQVARLTKQGIGHTGKAIGRIQPGENDGAAVARPVDRAIGLFHQWAQFAAHCRIGIIERLRHKTAG